MVREIVALSWCDLCMESGARSEVAESHRVVIDGKAYEVDLCTEHLAPYREFVDLVAGASAQHDAPAAAPKPKGKGNGHSSPGKASQHVRACLLCAATFNTPSPFTRHVKVEHGLENVGTMYGLRCPLCDVEHVNAQALGVHAAAKHGDHGVRDTPTLFAVATAEGDPFGVVASQRLAARALADAAATRVGTLEGV